MKSSFRKICNTIRLLVSSYGLRVPVRRKYRIPARRTVGELRRSIFGDE